MKWLIILMLFIGTTLGTTAEMEKARINAKAPEFSLVDSQGKSHNLKDYQGKYVVLEWINFDCPFVRKHYDSSNMQQLQKNFREKGVVWLSVCSSAPQKQGHFTGAELDKRIKAAKFNATAYLVDADGTVGRSYGAKTTPHMYLINPEGTLLYAGAIDDKPTTNVKDVETATNYLQAALDAAMAGKAVSTATTTPYGCSVKYKN